MSILDDGNTIRFADQGPGIQEKEKAQQPGFSSAIEPMKDFIRGVGSGFPIVKDYLDDREGSIVIEDNLTTGAVVTISLLPRPSADPQLVTQPFTQGQTQQQRSPLAPIDPALAHIALLPRFQLNDREQEFIRLMNSEGELRVTDLKEYGYAPATISNTFTKLEQQGLIEKLPNRKRTLTDLGRQLAATL